jgi:hypothetical protein
MMRKKLKLIIMALALTMPTMANSQKNKKEVFNWEAVINAIIKVESGGNPKAHNKKGDCVGVLQITPVLVKQCNDWLKAKKSKKRYTLADRYNVKKSKEMFVMFQSYYNKSNNVEKAIRMWNGGPGYSVSSTNNYYKKVMKHYKGG